MATIEQITDALTVILRDVEGMAYVPDDPPDRVNSFPFGSVTPADGDFNDDTIFMGKSLANEDLRFTAYLLVSLKNIPVATRAAIGLMDLFKAGLQADITLGGLVREIDRVSFQWTEVLWAGQPTFGYVVTISTRSDNC